MTDFVDTRVAPLLFELYFIFEHLFAGIAQKGMMKNRKTNRKKNCKNLKKMSKHKSKRVQRVFSIRYEKEGKTKITNRSTRVRMVCNFVSASLW